MKEGSSAAKGVLILSISWYFNKGNIFYCMFHFLGQF